MITAIGTLLLLTGCGAGLNPDGTVRRGGPDLDDPNEGDGTTTDDGGGDTGAADSGADGGDSDGGAGDGGTTDGGVDTGPAPDPVGEACYPGPDWLWDVCLPVVPYQTSWGADYEYPAPYDGSALYSAPTGYLDLSVEDPDEELAPNFVASELMSESKGRYGFFQTDDMANLQDLRDASGGALTINSGYRNVSYNAGVGGATYSRHMYGDAADMASSVLGLTDLGELCDDMGADYVGYYESHVHCDWRDGPLDPAFYGTQARIAPAERPEHRARLAADGAGWRVDASGFDEGEPLREWTAFNAAGQVVRTDTGRRFVPPAGAMRVQVRVGGQVVVSQVLDGRED
jgi:Peptidase M15